MFSDVKPFEASEKKIEIKLRRPDRTLRNNPNDRWNRIVEAGNAKIISKISSDSLDAYLLSESSLFVENDRVRMLTCGHTVPIRSLLEIVDLIGKDAVAHVHYERLRMLHPPVDIDSFHSECEGLRTLFPGKYYRLGPKGGDHVHLFCSDSKDDDPLMAYPFQIFMHGLRHPHDVLISQMTRKREDAVASFFNLNLLFPDLHIDSHLFYPGGISVNGVGGRDYFTIHVTHQPDTSFASFETNITRIPYSEILRWLLSVFMPRRFSSIVSHEKGPACTEANQYTLNHEDSCSFEKGAVVNFSNYKMHSFTAEKGPMAHAAIQYFDR